MRASAAQAGAAARARGRRDPRPREPPRQAPSAAARASATPRGRSRSTRRPLATAGTLLIGAILIILGRAVPLSLDELGAVVGPVGSEAWRYVTAPFVYDDLGAFLVVGDRDRGLRQRRRAPARLVGDRHADPRHRHPRHARRRPPSTSAGLTDFLVVAGGNGVALGLLGAWLMLWRGEAKARLQRAAGHDRRDRRRRRPAPPAAGRGRRRPDRRRRRRPGRAGDGRACRAPGRGPTRTCETAAVPEAELEAAVERLSDGARLREAEAHVAAAAPGLQRVLAEALAAGGWFEDSHRAELDRIARDSPSSAERADRDRPAACRGDPDLDDGRGRRRLGPRG